MPSYDGKTKKNANFARLTMEPNSLLFQLCIDGMQ